MIRDGTKTVTRRCWSDDYPRPKVGSLRGAITELFTPAEEIGCWIRITDVYEQPLACVAPDQVIEYLQSRKQQVSNEQLRPKRE